MKPVDFGRRGVLGGAAALAAIRPAKAAATGLRVVAGPVRVEVWLGERAWILDAGSFAVGCRVMVQQDDDTYAIGLTGALLPGTAFDASLSAVLALRQGAWRLGLRFTALGLALETDLLAWMAAPGGLALDHTKPLGIRSAFPGVTLPKALAAVRFDPSWRWRLAYPGPGIAETPPGSIAVDAAEIGLGDAATPGTSLHLSRQRPDAAVDVALGQAAQGSTLVLRTEALFCDALYSRTVPPDIAWHARGTLEARGPDGRAELEGLRATSGTVRHLDGAAHRQIVLALDTGVHVIRLNGHSLVVGGTGDSTALTARAGQLAPFAFHLALHSVHAPVLDADFARFDLVRTALVITASPAPDRATSDAHGWFGGMRVPLHDAWLSVRRGADLLNLRFAFRNMRLVLATGIASLRRETGTLPAMIQVTFPPQHLAEQVFNAEGGSSSGLPEPRTGLTQSRLSGETRLVFEITDPPDADPAAEAVPLSVEGLTHWDGMDLVVAARAAPGNATLDEQFDRAKLDRNGRLEDLMDAIRTSMAAPDAWETAVELPYRLLLSPGKRARWGAPQHLGAGPLHELWSASLDEGSAGDVRAIWSPDFARAVLGGAVPPPPSTLPPWTNATGPMRMALDASDRHELVGLTSMFGLPALLRRPPIPGSPEGQDLAANRPISTSVVPKPDGWSIALGPEQGFFVAKAAERTRLRLTSLGGTIDLQGAWEPPAGFTAPGSGTSFKGFTVEKASIQATLGRDLHVQVVRKGFLFPLGNRCSHVKVSERRLEPRAGVAGAEPTAYVLQRRFIVVGAPQKTFPALGQPFAGHAIPARQLRIVTRQTPDLIPIDEQPAASQDADGVAPNGVIFASPSIFWPMARTGPGAPALPVQFEFDLLRSDGKAGRATGPLIFVDNIAAHDPPTVKKLADLYRAIPASGRRTFPVVGELEYAMPTPNESGRHPTTSLTLTVHGRTGGAAQPPPDKLLKQPPALGDFPWDAGLEGADQPPFYPAMEAAVLRIESIGRMTGAPPVDVTAAYADIYLLHGADPAGNPSGLCLDILSPKLTLDVSRDSRATAGLATSNMQVGGWSPVKGPIGGAVPAGAPDTTPPATDAAQAGHFDPAQFLGSDFLQSRLMGLIRLRDLLGILPIDGAPQLLQTIDHEMEEVEGVVGAAEQRLATVLGNVTTSLDDLNAAADARLAAIIGAATPGARVLLYPALGAALAALRREADKLREASHTDPLGALALAGPLQSAMRGVLHEIGVIRSDPTPPILAELVAKLHQVLDALKQDALDALRDRLAAIVVSWLSDSPENGGVAALVRVAAVQVVDTGRLDDALAKRIAGRAAQTLFEDTVAPPLRAAFTAAAPLLDGAVLLAAKLADIANRAEQVAISVEAAEQTGIAECVGQLQSLADSLRAVAAALSAAQMSATAGRAAAMADQVDDARRTLAIGAARNAAVGGGPAQTGNWPAIRTAAAAAVRMIKAEATSLGSAVAQDGKAAAQHPFETLVRILSGMAGTVAAVQRVSDVAARAASLVPAIPNAIRTLASLAATASAALDGRRTAWLDALDAAEGRLTQAGTPALAALGVLRTRTQELAIALRQFGAACTGLAAAPRANTQQGIDAGLITGLSGLYAARLDTLDRLDALAQALAALEAALPAGLTIGALPRCLAGVVADLAEVGTAGLLVPLRDSLLAAGLVDVDNQFKTLAADWAGWGAQAGTLRVGLGISTPAAPAAIPVPVTAANLASLTPVAIAVVTTERRLVALLVEPALAAAVWAGSAAAALGNVLTPMKAFIGPLVIIQDAVLGPAQSLQGALQVGLAPLLLKPEVVAEFDAAVDTLAKSTVRLKQIGLTSEPVQAVALLRAEAAAWRSVPPVLGPPRVLGRVASSLLAGHFADIFPIGRLEDVLRSAIDAVVPSQVSYSYDWGTDLQAFPSGMPVFEPMARQAKPGRLTLSSRVTVDLRKPAASSFSATGSLESFRLNLIGPLQALIIEVDAVRFASSDHGGTTMKVELGQIRIGPALQFLDALSAWLFGGKGPYVTLQANPLGVLAGYSFSLPMVTVGAMTLANIGLDIAVELPFENQPATFRFGLSSRDRPFLLSVAPCYGGGGFVSFKAVANRIVGFEASFMFGAVVALDFGPLEGEGWVAAGFYVAKDETNGATISGFVQAVGEGHIACFGLSCLLEVAVAQTTKPGGESHMEGSAHYEFHFKAGFLEVGYGFDASYSYEGSKTTEKSQVGVGTGAVVPRRMFGAPVLLAAQTRVMPEDRYTMCAKVSDRSTDWKAYHGYFDLAAGDLA